MKFSSIQAAINASINGKNITQTLRDMAGSDINSSEIIEIAYDLQAGSYIADLEINKARWDAYHQELISVVTNSVSSLAGKPRILDAGTGEMTTLYRVSQGISDICPELYCCDISFSRIKVGRQYFLKNSKNIKSVDLFPCVANISELPFLNDSIDVVLTSHVIEPNGGREGELLREIFRVSRNMVLLFEPSYENNSPEGQARMRTLGYAKGIPEAIKLAGGQLLEHFPLKNPFEPLNPTWVYLCRKKETLLSTVKVRDDQLPWACPASKLPIKKYEDCYYSHDSHLAYPIIHGIPVLKTSNAVFASAFSS